MLESLSDLNNTLKNYGLRLIVAKGTEPHNVFANLFNIFDVDLVTWESDTEPYAKVRDQKVRDECQKKKIKVESPVSHTLLDPEELFARNQYQIPKTYQSLVGLINGIPKPVDTFDGFDAKNLALPDEMLDISKTEFSKDKAFVEIYE